MAKAFICFFESDRRKKDILFKKLKDSKIEPVLVEDILAPATLFAKKISQALEESNYLLPILTENSISSQWLNQEIGYAQKLFNENKIKIIPLVEQSLIDNKKIKGFVHLEMDLSFRFASGTDEETTLENFSAACDRLIAYLESQEEPIKWKYDFEPVFSVLAVTTVDGSGLVSVDGYLSIENNGKAFAIQDIELKIPDEITIPNQSDLKFNVDFLVPDGKTRNYLYTSPFKVPQGEIVNTERISFKSNFRFPESMRIELRPKLENLIKSLHQIEAVFKTQKGEEIPKSVKIIRNKRVF